jgi:cytochrome c556
MAMARSAPARRRHAEGEARGWLVACILALAASGGVGSMLAQQGPQADARPPVPVSISMLLRDPEMWVDRQVSVTGFVAERMSLPVFALEQQSGGTARDVLVIPPRLNVPLAPRTHVTVVGRVVKLDAARLASEGKPAVSIPPELAAKYQGQLVLLAAAVLDDTRTDFAKWTPPPMTEAEAAFDKVMKRIGPANAALRKAIEASDAAAVRTNARSLTEAFKDVQAFWKVRAKADALSATSQAQRALQAIDTAAGAGDWDGVKTQAGVLGQQCQGCHTTYRERGEDGSFFLKPQPK